MYSIVIQHIYICIYIQHIYMRCVSWLSHVWLFVTPWTAACQTPLSTGILQAGILGSVAMFSSRGSFQPRDQTLVSHIAADSLLSERRGNYICIILYHWGKPYGWHLPVQETQFWSLIQEDPLEKEMATHSSIFAGEIPMDKGAWQATVHGVAKN